MLAGRMRGESLRPLRSFHNTQALTDHHRRREPGSKLRIHGLFVDCSENVWLGWYCRRESFPRRNPFDLVINGLLDHLLPQGKGIIRINGTVSSLHVYLQYMKSGILHPASATNG